jgi:dTDP-4-dehydrorhamnose reductase
MVKSLVTDKNVGKLMLVNSIFPLSLNMIAQQYALRVIHISTDCVFNGTVGGYSESDQCSPCDEYGYSKVFGEPSFASIIRTSIIGEEKKGRQRGLLEWVRSEKGQIICGYQNHFWNGMTCLQLAKCIESIIGQGKLWIGVRHLHSPETVTKYDLVKMIDKVYDLGITINPTMHHWCDRSLSSEYDLVRSLEIPNLEQQLEEMKAFKV